MIYGRYHSASYNEQTGLLIKMSILDVCNNKSYQMKTLSNISYIWIADDSYGPAQMRPTDLHEWDLQTCTNETYGPARMIPTDLHEWDLLFDSYGPARMRPISWQIRTCTNETYGHARMRPTSWQLRTCTIETYGPARMRPTSWQLRTCTNDTYVPARMRSTDLHKWDLRTCTNETYFLTALNIEEHWGIQKKRSSHFSRWRGLFLYCLCKL